VVYRHRVWARKCIASFDANALYRTIAQVGAAFPQSRFAKQKILLAFVPQSGTLTRRMGLQDKNSNRSDGPNAWEGVSCYAYPS
jgi:hypothetical protein